MLLRPATMADADLLFAWRNDPGTVAACASQRPVEKAEHLAWLGKVVGSRKHQLFIVEMDISGPPIGTVRMDRPEIMPAPS